MAKRLAEAGTSYRVHLSPAKLLQAMEEVSHITQQGRAAGCRVVQAALSTRAGVRVTREDILDVGRGYDPPGIEGRRERLQHRGEYTETEPMRVWHIDSYEKLKMFGFYVHTGIDGGANFIVYITVSTNKSATELFRGYAQAVNCFRRPDFLRCDMAYEAGLIGQDMLDHMGPGSFLVGPSTTNQSAGTGGGQQGFKKRARAWTGCYY